MLDTRLILENITVSGNIATNWGGGIFNSTGIVKKLTFVTIANNETVEGSGIYDHGWIEAVHNTIIGDNLVGKNCYFSINPTMSNFNLDTDSSCRVGFSTVTSNRLGLAPLGYTAGSFTATHDLLAGSVIDSTDCLGFVSDQRSVVRPQDGKLACDIGAVEYQP
jgi:hypothetical protein